MEQFCSAGPGVDNTGCRLSSAIGVQAKSSGSGILFRGDIALVGHEQSGSISVREDIHFWSMQASYHLQPSSIISHLVQWMPILNIQLC